MKRKALPRKVNEVVIDKKPKLQPVKVDIKSSKKIELSESEESEGSVGSEESQEKQPIPTRDKKTNRLIFKDHPEFRPNLTPKEVLQAGV